MHRSLHRDPQSDRLIAIGALLLAVPCLFVVSAGLYFGWPLVESLLPASMRPIYPAAPGETLVLIADLSGEDGERISRELDDALTPLLRNTYLPNMRTARPGRPVADEESARRAGDNVNATLVIWGESAPDAVTLHVTVLRRIHDLEPGSFTLTFPSFGSGERDQLAHFIQALLQLHTGDAYGAWNSLSVIPTRSGGIDLAALTAYRVICIVRQGSLYDLARTVEDAVQAEPDNAALHALLAWSLAQTFDLDGALEAADTALDLDAGSADAFAIRGMVYAMRAEPDAALDDLNRALEIDPRNRLALRERAEAYRASEEWALAEADLTSLIEQTGAFGDVLLRAEMRVEAGDRAAALDDLDLADDLARNEVDIFAAQQRVREARVDAFRAFGEFDRALQEVESLLANNPSNPAYYVLRGGLLWDQGREEDAREAWEDSLPALGYAYDAYGYNTLAWNMALEGYYQPALEYTEKSLVLDPTNPDALHTRGFIHLGLGKYRAALGDFSSALQNGLAYDPVYRDMGDAYFGLEDYQSAIISYETYLSLAPYYAEDWAEVSRRLAEAREHVP